MAIRPFEGIYPYIAPTAYVDETALVIGQVTIGRDASIWPMAVVRGDVNSIVIGERTNIQDGSVLHVTHDGPYSPGGQGLTIAHDVTVGHHVVLHGCTVESHCLIGIGVQIMDGAIIRSRSLIGAGSLVTPGKEIEGGFLWVGRPAKKVRALTEEEFAHFEYSAAHYVKNKNRHLGSK
jgi:carbonic anhydrase/acetyltransferase-like protein (isoleucine patch superfamily)